MRRPDARIESMKPQEARIQALGGGKEKPFLNPKRVEGQGGQNQLERSTEKFVSKEICKENRRENPATDFRRLRPFSHGPADKPKMPKTTRRYVPKEKYVE